MKVKLSNFSFAAVGKMISVMLIFLSMFPICLQAQNNTKHVLHNGGGRTDAENAVFIILGDAFTSSSADQTKFLNRARETSTMILDKYPFSLFKERINIYAVETHSTSTSDGYFGFIKGGTYGWQNVDYTRLKDVILQHAAPAVAALVYANTTASSGWGNMPIAGTNAAWAVTGMGSSPVVMLHEIGHAFGKLWDEYCAGTTGGADAPNTSRDFNANTIKWRAWIGITNGDANDNIGVGVNKLHNTQGNCPDFAVPTVWVTAGRMGRCLMQGSEASNPSYCRVCSAEMTRLLVNKTTQEMYQANTDITQASVPGSQTRIVDGAFHGCYKLTTVNIPASISSIGDYAFLRCTTLTTITNSAVIPQTIDSTVFYGVNTSVITLRVPSGSVAAYKATDIWKDFNVVGQEPKSQYDITLFSTDGGKIGVDNTPVSSGTVQKVSAGGSLKVTFHPNAENQLTDVKINGVSNLGALAAKQYTFSDVAADWVIQGVFSSTLIPENCIITATCTEGGDVFVNDTPLSGYYDGEIEVTGHGSLTLRFEPNPGYTLTGVLIDNVNNSDAVTAREYVFSDVMNNHTIHAVFTESVTSIKPEKSNKRFGIRFVQNIVTDGKAQISVTLPNGEKAAQTQFVIYDNVGNVVFTQTVKGERAEWDLSNAAGRIVANGAYLVIAEVKEKNGKVYAYSAKLAIKRDACCQ